MLVFEVVHHLTFLIVMDPTGDLVLWMSHLGDEVIDVVLTLILDSVLDTQVSDFFCRHLVLLGLCGGSRHHFCNFVWALSMMSRRLNNGMMVLLRLQMM